MKICFTLDDVIRAKTKQVAMVYQKYVNNDIELDQLDFTKNDMCETLGIENEDDYRKFLYEDYGFQVFSEAPVTTKALDRNFNLWLLDLEDMEDIPEVSIASTYEYNQSIGFTCFFLSRIANKVREIYFPKSNNELWDKGDVVVTADPNALMVKPDGKVSVKINTDYNKDCPSDLSYDSLQDLLDVLSFGPVHCSGGVFLVRAGHSQPGRHAAAEYGGISVLSYDGGSSCPSNPLAALAVLCTRLSCR